LLYVKLDVVCLVETVAGEVDMVYASIKLSKIFQEAGVAIQQDISLLILLSSLQYRHRLFSHIIDGYNDGAAGCAAMCR
jgi:hypothetical protein